MSERTRVRQYFEGRNYFWLMHLSYNTRTEEDRREHWNYARDHSLIGLDLPEDVPRNWNEMSEHEKQALHQRRPNWYDHFEWFCNEMRPNDLVIAANGWDSLLGIGRIMRRQPSYDYREELRGIFFDHIRHVSWDEAWEYDNRTQLPTPLNGFNRTLLRVRANTRFWEILSDVRI